MHVAASGLKVADFDSLNVAPAASRQSCGAWIEESTEDNVCDEGQLLGEVPRSGFLGTLLGTIRVKTATQIATQVLEKKGTIVKMATIFESRLLVSYSRVSCKSLQHRQGNFSSCS